MTIWDPWGDFIGSLRAAAATSRAFHAAMRDETKRAGILAQVQASNALLAPRARRRSGVARNGHRP